MTSRTCNPQARQMQAVLDEQNRTNLTANLRGSNEQEDDNMSSSSSSSDSGQFDHDRDDQSAAYIMEDQGDDWNVGFGSESEDDDDDDDPAKASLRAFRAYCREVRDNMLPFSRDEVMSIELLAKLKQKKAPLDTYDDIMDWHIKHTPHEHWHQPIKSPHLTRGFRATYEMLGSVPGKKRSRCPACSALPQQLK